MAFEILVATKRRNCCTCFLRNSMSGRHTRIVKSDDNWRATEVCHLSIWSLIVTIKRYLIKLPRSIPNSITLSKGRRSFVFLFRHLGQGNRTWAIDGHYSGILIHSWMHSSQTRPGLESHYFLLQWSWYRVPVRSVKCERGGGLLKCARHRWNSIEVVCVIIVTCFTIELVHKIMRW